MAVCQESHIPSCLNEGLYYLSIAVPSVSSQRCSGSAEDPHTSIWDGARYLSSDYFKNENPKKIIPLLKEMIDFVEKSIK